MARNFHKSKKAEPPEGGAISNSAARKEIIGIPGTFGLQAGEDVRLAIRRQNDLRWPLPSAVEA